MNDQVSLAIPRGEDCYSLSSNKQLKGWSLEINADG